MKKFWNAILIAILGGVFGLQEFYVGRNFCGLFAIVFFWTGMPAVIAWLEILVWLFKGEEWFNAKFNIERNFY